MNTPSFIKRAVVSAAAVISATAVAVPGLATVAHAVEESVVPSAPNSVTAKASGSSIVVAWTAPTAAGTFPVSSYEASVTPGDAACTTTALTCTITGLVKGQVYKVNVRAISDVGLGALATVKNVAISYDFEALGGRNVKVTAPAETFAKHVRVTVANGAVHVGAVAPRAAVKSKQVIRYVVQLFGDSGAVAAKAANGALPGKPTTLHAAAASGSYRVVVTAQLRNGGKTVWRGPDVTIG